MRNKSTRVYNDTSESRDVLCPCVDKKSGPGPAGRLDSVSEWFFTDLSLAWPLL